jgi:hypothetical protein
VKQEIDAPAGIFITAPALKTPSVTNFVHQRETLLFPNKHT